MYKIVDTPSNTNEFNRIVEDYTFEEFNNNPLTGDFGRIYYPVTFEEKRIDKTFTVMFDNIPMLILLCTVGEDKFDWYNMPARYFIRADVDSNSLKKAFSLMIENINEIIKKNNLMHATIREEPKDKEITAFGNLALSNGWHAVIGINGTHDLEIEKDYFFKNLRKSYKGCINWGRKNIKLYYFNKTSMDETIFKNYRKLHAQVAGRVTRNDESWNKMKEHILAGRGELTLGVNNSGEAKTGTMIVDGNERSYYASGAYFHTEANEPLAHYPIFDAINRSSSRGMKLFDFGELQQTYDTDKKIAAVNFFKKGFCSKLSTFVDWHLKRN